MEFFDALAKAVNTRFVVPMPDKNQLVQLNARFGGRERKFSDIAGQYMEIVGYPFSNSTREIDLIKVRLPDEMIYPVKPIDENYAAFLRLLAALSTDQINQMYLQNGLTVKDLTPAQIPLYLEARHKNANVAFVLGDNKPLTDEQILAQPVRFSFAFQAKALFTDDEALPSLALFDYGTGLIWDPLVGADTKAFEKAAYEQDATSATPVGQINKTSNSSEKANATTLDYPQTRATTVGAALDDIGSKIGQTIVFDGELYARKVRATPIIISAGAYRADELLDAIGASFGAQSVFRNDVPTLEKRLPQKPISQLPPLVEQAQEKLRQLSFNAAGLPFLSSRFERKQTLYSELNGTERFYLRAKLLNENTEDYDKIDLSKHTFRFADQLLFIGETGGPDVPFVSSSLQLW